MFSAEGPEDDVAMEMQEPSQEGDADVVSPKDPEVGESMVGQSGSGGRARTLTPSERSPGTILSRSQYPPVLCVL